MYQVEPHLEYDTPPTGTTIGLAHGAPGGGGGGVDGAIMNCEGGGEAGTGAGAGAGAPGRGLTYTLVVDGCAGGGAVAAAVCAELADATAPPINTPAASAAAPFPSSQLSP